MRRIGRYCLVVALVPFAGCLPPQTTKVAQFRDQGPSSLTTVAAPTSPTYRSQQPDTPPPLPTPSGGSPSATPPAPEAAPYQVRICAWVNGKPLFEGDLINMAGPELYEAQKYAEPEKTIRRQQALKKKLKDLIDQEVVYQDALRKLEKQPQALEKLKDFARKQFDQNVYYMQQKSGLNEFDFKKQLKLQGVSLDSMRRQTERKFIVTEYMRSRVTVQTEKVGHQEIREYYETHKNEFQTVDDVDWEDIFILVGAKRTPTIETARQMAQFVAQRMAMNDPISKLLEYDDGDASTRKGKGYGRRKGEIKPAEVEANLFAMKPGEVGPLVELSTGIHVYRLVDRKYAGQMQFTEDVQTKIRNKLKNDIAQREYERIVRQLEGKTVIEVDADVLK